MFPGEVITTEKDARRWVQAVKKKGAEGVKLRGGTSDAIIAVYDETRRLGMGTASHHDQTGVYHVNALDSARAGLNSMEHWYGLPEALFENRTIQDYPPDYNYADEQWRFGQAGRLWQQADLILVRGNPVANFKLLYGTGSALSLRCTITRVGSSRHQRRGNKTQ